MPKLAPPPPLPLSFPPSSSLLKSATIVYREPQHHHFSGNPPPPSYSSSLVTLNGFGNNTTIDLLRNCCFWSGYKFTGYAHYLFDKMLQICNCVYRFTNPWEERTLEKLNILHSDWVRSTYISYMFEVDTNS